MTVVRTAARTLLAGTFVVGGARALANPDPLATQAQPVADRVAPLLKRIAPWLPSDPQALVRMNAAVQLIGGLALATGRFRRAAALLLAGSLVPTTLVAHRFWEYENQRERRNQQLHFGKNLGLIGGLVLESLDTEGRPGLRWRTRHAIGHGVDRAQRARDQARDQVRRTVRTARRETRIAAIAARMGRRFG